MQISLKTWVTKYTSNWFQIVGKVINGAEPGNPCDIPTFGTTAVVQNVEVTWGVPCTASSTPSETIIHSHISTNSFPYITGPVEANSQGESLVCSHILHYSSSVKCENNMESPCCCGSLQTQVIRLTWNEPNCGQGLHWYRTRESLYCFHIWHYNSSAICENNMGKPLELSHFTLFGSF